MSPPSTAPLADSVTVVSRTADAVVVSVPLSHWDEFARALEYPPLRIISGGAQ